MQDLWRNGFKKEQKIGKKIRLSKRIERKEIWNLSINKLNSTIT